MIATIATVPNTTIMAKRKRIIYKIKVLYQYPARRHNTYEEIPFRQDWTDSLETYQNAARRQYELLKENPRTAENMISPDNPVHLITLKYFHEYNNLEVIALWKKIRPILTAQGIIAYGVVEITTRRHYVSDKKYYDYPINQIHYHFLVANDLSESELRNIFNNACLEAGLKNKKPNREFEVQYDAITNRKEFLRKCMYILKYDRYKHEAILFQRHTGINKIFAINGWFNKTDDSGKRIDKKTMWKDIVAGWYPDNSTTTQRQSHKITIQFSILCYGLLGILTTFLRKENSHDKCKTDR